MKQVTITINEKQLEFLKKLKNRRGWSQSLLIRESLIDFMEKYRDEIDAEEE